VIVPRDRRPKGIRTHRPARIHRREITTHLAIRTTTLARTILDLAARLPDKRRRRTVHNSLHSKYMTNSQLAEVLQRNPTHPGTRLLTPFLAETNTGITRSEIEHTFTQLGADYDFPRFLTNVTLPNGYTADVLFPDHGLIVELDSWSSTATASASKTTATATPRTSQSARPPCASPTNA
jgi:hypothetical protein